MKRNRKTPAGATSIAANTVRAAVPLVSAMAMVMLYMAASAKCNALSKTADRRERELAAKTADLERAQSKWDEVRSSGNLDRALIKWGLPMALPKPSQIVRMDETGRPYPSQMSVALLRSRNDARRP